MVISKPETANAAGTAAAAAAGLDASSNSLAHPSGIPQDQIDNIMSGIANTGDVKMNNHRKKLRQRFDIIKKLGQGTYGKVQLGINKETGQEVAIKTIKKCKIEAEADLVRIRREVQIMSSVQHPNIIHIYEVFENREKMVLVMEFAAGGELYDYLSERKVLSEEEARRIFRQVATAVYYCHKHKICHRDLKLENILLDERGNAKIADFGLSNVFDDQRLLGTFCGSPLYASPEIVEGTPYQGPEVDCWSLGVLLYTLVYGSMPFDGSNFKRLVKQISQGDYYEPRKPSRASTLIRDMLTVCPRKRATIEQICSHWWVNENDNVSCLELAEDLANQTPVRLDVLLSLTPATITADQLVVPSADGTVAGIGGKSGNERVPRSHSVGSIRDIPANTEAERRILDMVAAGGEAALMPSPTRTITPAQSPVQTKRKLQPTVSNENAAGTTAKKKEKPANSSFVISETTGPLTEETPMDTEGAVIEEPPAAPTSKLAANYSQKDMQLVGDLCDQLMQPNNGETAPVARQPTRGKLDAVVETPEEKNATKVIKKFVNKRKTADLVNAIAASNESAAQPTPNNNAAAVPTPPPPFVRKCSLQDESTLNKFNTDSRKSRILETAEKFQQMTPSAAAAPTTVAPDKPKKLSIPGVSVGSFKREFERKATNTATPAEGPTPGERRALEQVAAAAAAAQEAEALATPPPSPGAPAAVTPSLEASDSKNSVTSISLEKARRSMENSIALLLQAQNESNKELDQLCAQTETIGVSEPPPTEADRERKLQNARAIIGNAIQPVIRRPTAFYGIGNAGSHGMSMSGSHKPLRARSGCNFRPVDHNVPAPQTAPAALPSSVLAAAKQTLQQRLFAGGVPQFDLIPPPPLPVPVQQQRPATWQPQTAYSTASIFQPLPVTSITTTSPFKMLQQQYQQKCQEPQPPASPHQRPFSAMFTPPPSPLKAHAQAIYASSNGGSNNNTMSHLHYPAAVVHQSARQRSIQNNQAQDTSFNANAKTALPAATAAAMWLKSSPGGDANAPAAVKTSTASITLKSATLPRRKLNAKSEVQLEIKPKPRLPEQPQPAMRFTTEMQHPVADLRSAPPREGPIPYSPIKTSVHARATSLEPKEHIIPIQRPPTAQPQQQQQQHVYARTGSNTTTRSGSLSRQSTIESESDLTSSNVSQSTITGAASSQPIKKSPREFIIPIAVEGGGFITPRQHSIEPSESSHTTASSRSTFSRLRPSRRIGSLLSEAGFDEASSPFQKNRTTSITRDGGNADDGFTPHRLRSSRPVKKISQDNDSQSSCEEDDDDDGFEILTAENLFSTLLQRVRNLTNRLNVNNDLTAGFPSHSSRLLTDMSRRAPGSPFWSQGSPFGSRLNSGSNSSGLGAPWRHSMSRDLGSDMESMFSRTGATLPRGHSKAAASSSSAAVSNAAAAAAATELTAADAASKAGTASAEQEPLDLADLDLSRLRLSKKDLETLSSITPGLPKCFQEQLLAKLPPTQARKLSRTLSVQNSTASTATVKVYKRSQSGGRGACIAESSYEAQPAHKPLTDAPKTTAASTAIYRRSLSRTRYDYETAIPTPTATASSAEGSKSRSSSVCHDDYAKSSLCNSSYTSDISDKYKYYSPYLSKSSTTAAKDAPTEVGLQKRYSAALGRPPSGCLSPPPPTTTTAQTLAPPDGSSSLRRRSAQRRISRFLRPDFFDEPPPPVASEESTATMRRLRERETQSVLREIRERSCDRLDDAELRRRKHSLPNAEAEAAPVDQSKRHVRNKSMDTFTDSPEPELTASSKQHKRRSVSRPRELDTELDKHQLADKILQELQLLSVARTQQDLVAEEPQAKTEQSYSEQTSTIKKVKKLKPKEPSNNHESSTDVDAKLISSSTTSTSTTLVRKVKKVVKKSETAKTPTEEAPSSLKETKLKRPKSYPMKDLGLSLKCSEPVDCANVTAMPSKLPSKVANELPLDAAASNLRESRLIRPKSYPATKLAAPKKVTRSGAAITSIAEVAVTPTTAGSMPRQSNSEEKSLSATPPQQCAEKDNSSSSESRPTTTMKKIIKVSKKSKLVPPTPVTPTTPTTTPTNTSTPVGSSKESSPVIKGKEKSPEKKPSKGLLYAIGQKFEKLRDSAMNKEKKAALAAATNATTPSASALACGLKQSSPEHSSSTDEKTTSTTLLRKKKSTETVKAEKPAETPAADKRSRFDSMLRSLRERSVPRAQPRAASLEHADAATPKRAASVENLPAGGSVKQTGAVNKMLGGFFKRFDRESSEQRRVRSTRSTSNIEQQVREEAQTPTSPIYQNAEAIAAAAKLKPSEENCNCESACPQCRQHQSKEPSVMQLQPQSNKEKRKGLMLDLSKLADTATTGNMLSTSAAASSSTSSGYRKAQPTLVPNGNGLYSNLPPYPGALKSASNNSSSQQSMDNVTNNNSINTNNNSSSLHTSQTSGYRTSSAHEINRNNLLTPSFENIANYSSDSRSYQDDCASTSTFMSPTEEPELYFDNWSICSEDNYMLHATPSPTVSRLSRASQLSSPTRCSESSDPNESVIDRIKRRSFYSRFNEQKPRRTSSIVGPSAVRDYYREQQAAHKARTSQRLHPSDVPEPRAHSPDIAQQFFRPLKLSPVGTELKPPVYRSALDYSTSSSSAKPRKSLNDIRANINTSPSFLSKRYGSSSMDAHDYTVPMRYKSSSSSSPSNGAIGGITASSSTSYYNTYNPKRRSSYTLNGGVPTGSGSSSTAAGSSRIDSYATLGRRSIRPYDHRTMSLLEPPTTSSSTGSSAGYQRREARTPVRDYTASISRSGSRYRTSSATRSPTNI